MDLDRALEAIRLQAGAETAGAPSRAELDLVAERARAWFEPAALDELLGPPAGWTDRLARDWVARAGKRWRPILTACTWRALAGPRARNGYEPACVRTAAVAVECFHKASLVHDDIEDADESRYDEPALHVAHGVPIALNLGDLLLGEGYRLLGGADLPPEARARMLTAAAAAHRKLCLGQGTELQWARRPRTLDVSEVLEIFRNKTAPAFGVSLQLGAICAGVDGDVERTLLHFSEQLGVSYQIRDDLDDLRTGREEQLLNRPSILAALAWQVPRRGRSLPCAAVPPRNRPDSGPKSQGACPGGTKARREAGGDAHRLPVASLRAAEGDAAALFEEYRVGALAALEQLESFGLRTLLEQVVGRILPPVPPRPPAAGGPQS